MSRLDSFISRLMAQRSCLAAAKALIADVPGPVLELGLGHGRTYDHLRELFPNREIYVFDREVAADPDCVPPADRLLLGEFSVTLPLAAARIGRSAALVHADIGSGDAVATTVVAALVSAHLGALAAPRAVVASDQPFDSPCLEAIELPADVERGRYFFYRKSHP